MNSTQGGIEQTNYRVDEMAQPVTQIQHGVEELKAARAAASAQPAMSEVNVAPPPVPGPVIAPAPVPVPSPGEDPVQTYQSAYRDYQRGNYDLAIAGFRDFLGKN